MRITKGHPIDSVRTVIEILDKKMESKEACIVGLYEHPRLDEVLSESNIIRSAWPLEAIQGTSFSGMNLYWFTYVQPENLDGYTRVVYDDKDAWVHPLGNFIELLSLTGGSEHEEIDLNQIRQEFLNAFKYENYEEYVSAVERVSQRYYPYVARVPETFRDWDDLRMVAENNLDALVISEDNILTPLRDYVIPPIESDVPIVPTKIVVCASSSTGPLQQAFGVARIRGYEFLDEHGEVYMPSDIEELLEARSKLYICLRFGAREDWLYIMDYADGIFEGICEAAMDFFSFSDGSHDDDIEF